MKKILFLAIIIFVGFTAPARAEVSPEKRVQIEKMLRLTGMEKLMEQIKGQMLSGFKGREIGIPDDFWARLSTKMDTREMIEKIIPVYDKYYSVEDLKAVNAFYESPAGQKVLSTLPQVMAESMKIGREWGEKIGREAAEEIQAELKKKKQE